MKDPLLKKILELLYNLHKEEMNGHKLQCVSKGYTEKNILEYHVTWTTNGIQYRSYVRSYSGALQETSFG